MADVGALFVGVTFIVLLQRFGVIAKPREVMAISSQAYRDLSNPLLHDDAKEAAMRGHSKALGRLFLVIVVATAAAAIIPLAVIWLLDVAGILPLNTVLDALVSVRVLVAATLLLIGKLVYDRMMQDRRASHGSD